MFALFEVEMLDKVLTTLLKEIFVLIDDLGEINLAVNVREYYIEINFENIRDINGVDIRNSLLIDLKKNPEINIIKEYMRDRGGEILFNYGSSLIIIKIPINKREIQGKEILERINNINYIKQII